MKSITWRQRKAWALLLSVLAGCASPTAPMIGANGIEAAKGRAVFYGTAAFGSCVALFVSFSRKTDKGHEPMGRVFINYDFLWSTKLGSIDLPPGEYAVAGVECPRSDYQHFFYMGPLGTFTVNAGEVVDIGSFTVLKLPTKRGEQDSIALVEPIAEARLSPLKSDPDLARRYVVRHMRTTATADDLAEIEHGLLNAGYSGRINDAIRAALVPVVRAARDNLKKQ